MTIDKNEFRKYAVMHHGIGSQHVDSFINRAEAAFLPTAMTPYITEERQLNVAQMDVFSRLMIDRIIFLGEGVNDKVANIIQAQLLFLQSADAKRDIQIYINSPGGSVHAGLGIYDTMHHISPDVCTTCIGVALSMSAVLLCAGAPGKRSALRHARVMIHQPSGGAQGVASDIDTSVREILKLQKELYTIIARHTGQDYQKVHNASDRDYWMMATEAKEFGMIDQILGVNERKEKLFKS